MHAAQIIICYQLHYICNLKLVLITSTSKVDIEYFLLMCKTYLFHRVGKGLIDETLSLFQEFCII